MRRLCVFVVGVSLMLAGCGQSPPVAPTVPAPVTIAVSGDAAAVARALGRGVNLGNILEAPTEGLWGLRLSDSLFNAARASGATTIRLPIRWSAPREKRCRSGRSGEPFLQPRDLLHGTKTWCAPWSFRQPPARR